MFFKLLLLSILILGSYSVGAITVADERGSVELTLPQGWRYEKNLLGLPHVFLSPQEKRASLSITITGIQDVNLPHKDLAKNQSQYQEGRKKWAQQREFTITKFIPYSHTINNKISTHSIGVLYKDKNVEYLEMSYFTECPRSLVHMKALGEFNSPHQLTVQQIPNSLHCH